MDYEIFTILFLIFITSLIGSSLLSIVHNETKQDNDENEKRRLKEHGHK